MLGQSLSVIAEFSQSYQANFNNDICNNLFKSRYRYFGSGAIHRKNNLAEECKILIRYRSENNFIFIIKIITYVGRSN